MGQTVASYLPESMLIILEPDYSIFTESGQDSKPTATTIAVFFHEYFHYLHNLSTASGVVAFLNTIDLWRHFRFATNPDGFCVGSGRLRTGQVQQLSVLQKYLVLARVRSEPTFRYMVNPKSLKISSAALRTDLEQNGEIVLSKIICDAEGLDDDGNLDKGEVTIRTLEILESAAWLLEKQLVQQLDPAATMSPPPLFPYRVVEAAAEGIARGLSEIEIIACALTALQSSDAPAELHRALTIAADAKIEGKNVLESLRSYASKVITETSPQIIELLNKTATEFSTENSVARAIRYVIDVSKRALEHRKRDPFFELTVIGRLASNPNSWWKSFVTSSRAQFCKSERGMPRRWAVTIWARSATTHPLTL